MTQQDVLYRLFTLRRLNVVGVLIIALGLWSAQAMTGGAPFGPGLGGSLIVLGISSALLIWHNLIYPAGWVEAFSLPIAAALSLIAFSAMLASGNGTIVLIVLCTAVVFGVAFFAFGMLFSGSFGKIPVGEAQRTLRVHLDASAEAFVGWAFERPSATKGAHRTGPVNDKGLIPVWFDICTPTEENGFDATAPAWASNRVPDYYFRIIENGPVHQVVQSIIPGTDHKGAPLTSMSHLSVTQTGPESCLVTEREVHNLSNVHNYVLAWLRNDHQDRYREIRDAIHGVESPALAAQSHDTLMAALVRAFARQGVADPS